ncbi:MAG: hypothetical protein ACRYF3_02885 [Janthinobacterium lividum]
METTDRQHFLEIYLNDHLAGATAGLARFTRAARSHRGTDAGEKLATLRREIAEDRRSLSGFMRSLGVRRRLSLQLAGRLGEALVALKPNGRVLRRSPLSTVVELEALTLAVQGKGAGWVSLRELARTDNRLDAGALEDLVQRAQRQAVELEGLRRASVVEVLGGVHTGLSVVPPQAG